MNKSGDLLANRRRNEIVIKDMALQLLKSGLINTEYLIAAKEEKGNQIFTLYHNILTPFPKICGTITEKEARAQMSINNEQWTAVLTISEGKRGGLEISEHSERSYVENAHAICLKVMAAHNIRFWSEDIKRVVKTEVRKDN
ncbi:MAG: hypothetical protein KGH61_04125 [Candidatus Micrarchaeota archaeon]|nr:hypothetical protein [Candidatus Micrarchaeota archaeon]MDE1848108.1 hypothetical protein [Candidatus Micrarchaeota archaeon]MDE1864764.1 hypothetical protein [Candidatus Micrarchaeota archaeon]